MARNMSGGQGGVIITPPGSGTRSYGGIVAVFRANAGSAVYRHVFGMLTSTFESPITVGLTDTHKPFFYAITEASAPTMTVTSSDGWVLLAAFKDTGAVAPRFDKYVYATDTWTHESSGTTVANPAVGGTVNNACLGALGSLALDPLEGDLAAVAYFQNRILSAAQVESMAFSLHTWLALAPTSMWVLDQQSTGQKVRDWTGDAHETSLQATSVTADSVPVLGYGHPVVAVTRQAGSVGATVTPGTVAAVASIPLAVAGLARTFTTASTSVQATGLTAGRTYRARVRARDAAGNWSGWSNDVTFTTALAPTTVAATASIPTPTITGSSGATRNPATVAATASIPGPTVTVSASRSPATVAATASIPQPGAGLQRTFTPSGTSQSVTGLLAGSRYVAQVRARDAAGNWSGWSDQLVFTTAPAGIATVAAVASIPTPTVGGTPPTVTAGRARPVVAGEGVLLDVAATPPGGATISGYAWTIQSGGGSLTNAGTVTPTYTAPGSGSGLVTVRATVYSSNGGTATADVTVSYGPTIVAAENALTGTPRATWDLASPNLGGINTLQGFCDGFTIDKGETANFKIAQSDGAGWSAEVFRLGWYAGDGARSYGTVTPDGTQLANSQAQPSPLDADATTTALSADCSNWSTTLTWTPPAWAPSGIYLLRLNRTGGGASHIMFIVRDDDRTADLMLMPSDSTWTAYNAWGGMGGSMYSGNSLYAGTSVNQYSSDCAKFVSYNKPVVNRGACDSGRAYGAVEWSNFFTSEYPAVRFLERNGHDVKYYSCLDAAGDATGALLGNVSAAMAVGHNEYWSNGMRSGWEAAKAAGRNLIFFAGNEVFWRLVGTNPDSNGRPRTWECQKSTIDGRGNTRPEWTGTWRDPDGAGKGGNAPENSLTGTIFVVNGPDLRSLVVPFTGGYSQQPLWRHTEVADLASGSWSSPGQILGFEWDVPGPAFVSTTAANYMAVPNPRVRYASTATYSISSGLLLTDAGDVYDAAGTATHRLVIHPSSPGGGITFGAGTVNWPLGLDDANTYQQGSDNTSQVIRQATINLLVDMGAPPSTLMSGLVEPTAVDWFVDVTPGTVTAVAAIPAPTVTGSTSATASPATVAAVAAIPGPAVRTGSTAATATVSAVAAIPAPTVRTGTTATPGTVAATATIAAATVQAGTTAAPGTVTATAAIPTPSVQAGSSATVAPATVAAVASVPAATVHAGTSTTVTPATVAAVAVVPAPTVQAAGNVTVNPATVTATAAVPAPAVQAASTVSPAAVAAFAAVPQPTVATATVVTLTTVAGVAAIATPAVTGQAHATVTPGTVMAVASIGAVSRTVGLILTSAETAQVTGTALAAEVT